MRTVESTHQHSCCPQSFC